jgi:hypothetical protein
MAGISDARGAYSCRARYPVKCDCVPKDAVVDLQKDDSKTLHPGLLSEFMEQKITDTIDCTVMKATWFSKRQ